MLYHVNRYSTIPATPQTSKSKKKLAPLEIEEDFEEIMRKRDTRLYVCDTLSFFRDPVYVPGGSRL